MIDRHDWPRGDSRASRIAYAVVQAMVATFCRVWLRLGVEGRDNLPRERPYVLAPVHRSNVDTAITAAASRRRTRYMGKDSLWKNRQFGWFISSLGAFPVVRGTADREALRRCVEILEGGEALVLFPEGERKSGPIVHPLFDGTAYVAIRAGVPIVPVGIGGSERAMPKGARFIYPRRCRMVIGRPIEPPHIEAGGRVPRAAVKVMTAALHEELQRLFDAATIRSA